MDIKEEKMNFENLGAIQAEIDFLEENTPNKKNKVEYLEWSERFNYLCNLYNKTTDSKIYSNAK